MFKEKHAISFTSKKTTHPTRLKSTIILKTRSERKAGGERAQSRAIVLQVYFKFSARKLLLFFSHPSNIMHTQSATCLRIPITPQLQNCQSATGSQQTKSALQTLEAYLYLLRPIFVKCSINKCDQSCAIWHLIPWENGNTQVPHGEEGSLKGRATEKCNIIEYPLKDKLLITLLRQ